MSAVDVRSGDGKRRAPWLSEGPWPRESGEAPATKLGTEGAASQQPTKRRLVPTLLTPQTVPSKSAPDAADGVDRAAPSDSVEPLESGDSDSDEAEGETRDRAALGEDECQEVIDALAEAEV